MAVILVSACLLGCKTRYDGKSTPCEKVLKLAEDNVLVPVCPEQLGGLTTPRLPSERIPGTKSLKMVDGTDVTENYMRGVQITLDIAKLDHVDYCILKSDSPSCGKGRIYDGSFSGRKIPGNGVTAEALLNAGYRVLSENEL